MIAISPIHRKLAEVIHMSTDINGNTYLGHAELMLLIPLLRQNLALVQQLDSLKQLAFVAYEAGDFDWMHDLCSQMDELEAQMM